MIVSFLYLVFYRSLRIASFKLFPACEYLCCHFFSASLSGKLSCVQGASFQDYGASKDVVSATIMFCLTEINDIGLEIAILNACDSYPKFGFFFG